MLKALFPRIHGQYESLPLLGARLDDFAGWLFRQGYIQRRVLDYLRMARRVDRLLWHRGVRSTGEITRERLRACGPPAGRSRDAPRFSAAVHRLELYLEERGDLPAVPMEPPTRSQVLVGQYRSFLADIRGLARSTLDLHTTTAALLLAHLGYEEQPARLAGLSPGEIESFVRDRGRRVGRASLQHEVAYLRSFLRFLALRGEAPVGLGSQIDTPRVYRLERLPRAMPWETVIRFLQSIDRSTARGLRDYAIFLLMATYGLRGCEAVSLTLDDVDWRAKRLCIRPCKRPRPLLLPLTDEVGAALIDYLRDRRPDLPRREIFLRCGRPSGTLGSSAVGESFRAWSSRSGLPMPTGGPHCIRHSYAVHLLRQGLSLKTIGDLLGHRSAESTCVYLRLAVEDLRDVALPLLEQRVREGSP